MAGISNNLYPPIFNQAYMPAFVRTNGCKVYFSISIYNSLAEINTDVVQVVVQNQKTNQSMLNPNLYPSGVKITTLNVDNERQGDDKYYIQIFPKDMDGQNFNLNEYYKVQVRFTSIDAPAPPSTGIGLDRWLGANLAAFSEWSQVILIKGISNPVLKLNNFTNETDTTTFTLSDIIIAGRVSFDDADDETLKSYHIYLYDSDLTVIEDSGEIYCNSYQNLNQIQYQFKYNFESNTEYILGVQIVTRNLFSWPEQKQFVFSVDEVAYTIFDATISSIVDNKGGRIGIHLQNDDVSSIGINVIIRRASSRDSFLIWEDVYTTLIPSNSPLDLTWYDYTVESGVWYKYRAQKRNKAGFRSSAVQLANPIMLDFEDMFLTTGEGQLKIRFDPQINSYAHTVSESRTETIGSQYPFIRRNGNVNYRTFPISGTITWFMDARENLMHASKEDVYGSYANLYSQYNENNQITEYDDYIYEREFRKKVIDFLYKNNVKLFRSATEGNILVKLMEISFTPNATLSRRIYSFSCTAYEIDEYNYTNCVKYGVQDQGAYQEQTNYLININGQISRPSQNIYYKDTGSSYSNRKFASLQTFGSGDLIKNDVLTKYQKLATSEMKVEIDALTYLKIELTSDPYLIGISNAGVPYMMTSTQDSANAQALGHIAIINGQYIIINRDGIYELTDSNTNITSLQFVSPNETGSLSYQATINESENTGQMPKEYSTIARIGQYWGGFSANDSIYRKIANKYNQSYSIGTDSSYEQNLQTIMGIRIQAAPGTSCYVKEKQDNDFERHVIGETGLLEFYNDNTDIRELYFVGPHVTPAADSTPLDSEFVETNISKSTFSAIDNPLKNYVYKINGERYIYYQGGWNKITDDNDIEIDSVQAIVDYYCKILRKRY